MGIRDLYGIWVVQVDHCEVLRGSLWGPGRPYGSSWWSMMTLAFKVNISQVHWGSLQALWGSGMRGGTRVTIMGCRVTVMGSRVTPRVIMMVRDDIGLQDEHLPGTLGDPYSPSGCSLRGSGISMGSGWSKLITVGS